ncbi:MAG TPA: multidrug efflux SMR transporter [Bacillota bacterium]|nr:multidrug efflux SMR transporter [Bacillota bacterium]
MAWFLLSAAIVAEVAGTLSLRASDGFTRGWFTLASLAGYAVALVLLGFVLKHGMPVGVAYGIWAATGVALVAVLGRVLFGDALTVPMAFGLALIMAGVLLVETGATR